jgi:hypothetical protein
MNLFRSDIEDHPYGFVTLLKVWASDNLGIEFDANQEQPVCSVYVQRIFASVLQGDVKTLWSPNDVARHCERIVEIN